MGSSSSITGVENKLEDTCSVSSQDSAVSHGSLSSGFHSSASTCDHTVRNENRMSKPKLGTRPSVVVRILESREEEEEQNLEDKHIKQTPALKGVLQGFEDCKKTLADPSKRVENAFQQLRKMLDAKVKKPFETYSNDEQRVVMANRLAKKEFVKYVTEYYDFVMDELDIIAVTGDFVEEAKLQEDPAFKLILTIREILWNFSDGSHKFSEELSMTSIIRRLVVDLEKINEDGLQQMEEEGEDIFAFSSAVGILHNCARNPDVDKEVFRDAGAVDKLYPFLQSSLVYVKMITLLALGNMIKEDQVQDLKAGLDVFDFLIDAIKEAMRVKDRKRHGFHLSELVDGLASLAQSDQNKKLIMLKNPLDMMTKILESKNQVEVLAAIKLVWELAFLEENKQKILSNADLKQILSKLKSNANNGVKKAAMGAWFVIFDKDERITGDEKRKSTRGALAEKSLSEKPMGKHVMFSYCWGDKEIVYKIYRILNSEGYPIWIDFNEMDKYGNVLEGMARAVEAAAVILIFYSEKYKNSQNCRTEADYAYCLKKEIIPIKLQRGYTPDGWLGALIGARFFIEFSPQKDFDTQVEQLHSRLPKFDKSPKSPDASSLNELNDGQNSSSSPSTPKTPMKKVLEWKKPDIEKWAKDHKLSGTSISKVTRLSPENLHFLYNVMNKAPETFYRWLEDKLQLKSLDDLMNFDSAMKSLQPYI